MTRSGPGGEDQDVATASDGSFARALERLKRDGCLLMVTGDVPEPVSARASRKLLGTPTEFRTRVLAVTDPAVSEPATHLPGTLCPESDGVTLIDERPSPRTAVGVVDVAEAILDALPTDLPSDEGNVRFALATLAPFRAGDHADAIPTALDTLRDAAHATTAIGAIHLPLPDDDPDVDALTPHVDARIEVRDTNTALPEQRWYLPDRDATTNWVTM